MINRGPRGRKPKLNRPGPLYPAVFLKLPPTGQLRSGPAGLKCPSACAEQSAETGRRDTDLLETNREPGTHKEIVRFIVEAEPDPDIELEIIGQGPGEPAIEVLL